jgi:CBS domain-containing protein
VGWRRATEAVSRMSIVLAIVLFILGFVGGNILIVVIAFFIFLGAQQENQMVEMKEVLRGVSIAPLLEKNPPLVDAGASLQSVFELMAEKNRLAFLVEKPNGFGVVSYESLESIPRRGWQSTRAGDVAQSLPAITLCDKASKLMEKVLTKGYPFFPVVEGGRLVGVVHARSLQRLYEIEKLKRKEA